MREYIFDPDKCDVPLLERIEDVPMIVDCEIPTAPDPIRECPDIDVPLAPPVPPPFPPIPDAICPTIDAEAEADATIIAETDPVYAYLHATKVEEEECAFLLEMELGIPEMPCPSITATATAIGASVTVTVGGTPRTEIGDPCPFDFNFLFDVPQGPTGPIGLPGLDGPTGLQGLKGDQGDTGLDGSPGSPGVDGSSGQDGSPGLDGSPGDDGYDGDTGPCPNVTIGYVKANAARVTVEALPSEPCELSLMFDFDFLDGPCATLEVGTVTTTHGEVEVTIREIDTCEEWTVAVPGSEYQAGNLVIHNDVRYICVKTHDPADETDPETDVADEGEFWQVWEGSCGCKYALDFDFDGMGITGPAGCPMLHVNTVLATGGDQLPSAVITKTPESWYEEWQPAHTYEAGEPTNSLITYDGRYYACIQSHTSTWPLWDSGSNYNTNDKCFHNFEEYNCKASHGPDSPSAFEPGVTVGWEGYWEVLLSSQFYRLSTPDDDIGSDWETYWTPADCAYHFDFVIPKGPTGPDGDTGNDGPCPDVTATAYALDPEYSPSVSVIKDPYGCSYDFDFYLPRGPTGPAGEDGIDGDAQCPTITATAVSQADTEPPVVTVTKKTGCSYEFSFGLPRGPAGSPGSTGSTSFTVTPQSTSGSHYATLTANSGGYNYHLQTYAKSIIVPVETQGRVKQVGLHCMEMPEVVFMDIYTSEVDSSTAALIMDEWFVKVCEPGSIRVVSAVSSLPECIGAHVQGNWIYLDRQQSGKATLTALVAGVRKGLAGCRFPEYSVEQMVNNNSFWARTTQPLS